jgi:hypothetical protein
MRWALFVALTACTGSIEPVGGAPDASPVGPERPLTCDVERTEPLLPRLCMPDGWCWEAPTESGPIQAFLATEDAFWIALDGRIVRITNGHAEWLPSPGQVDGLYSTATGVVAHAEYRIHRFEAGSWLLLGDVDIVQVSVGVDGALWGVTWGHEIVRYDGSAWVHEPLPVGDVVRALAAHSSSEAWISVDTFGVTSTGHTVIHRTSEGVRQTTVAESVYALWTSDPDDVWIATDTHVEHVRGPVSTMYRLPYVRTFLGRSADDFWAITLGSGSILHFDGAAWSSCANHIATKAFVGDRDQLWMLRGTTLGKYADGWNEPRTLDQIADLEVIPGSPERFALTREGTILRRTADARWFPEMAPVGIAAEGLASRSFNDVWAFGTGTLHFDGVRWSRIESSPTIYDLCVTPTGTAVASSWYSLVSFLPGSPQGWSTESGFEQSGSMFCLPDGDVWAAAKGLAHRENGTWRVSAPVDNLTTPFAPPGGPLYSLGLGIARLEGSEWNQVASPIAGHYLGGSGTSATDIWFLSPPTGGIGSVTHYDGSSFAGAVAVPDIAQISAIGADDVLLVGGDFRTWRMRAGVQTPLSGAGAGDTLGFQGYGDGAVWFASATSGFATSRERHLLRFDGSSWTPVTTFPGTAATLLTAFAVNDVYMIADGRTLAGWNGKRWTTTALPVTSNVSALWGATSNDLWVATTGGEIVRIVRGTPQLVSTSLAAAERPHELWRIHGTSTMDVWFSGNVTTNPGEVADVLWHWDGTSLARHRRPRDVARMRLVAGNTVAAARDPIFGAEVWEHLASGWRLRPDLSVGEVFPPPSRSIANGRVIEESPSGPWWALGDQSAGFILRAP